MRQRVCDQSPRVDQLTCQRNDLHVSIRDDRRHSREEAPHDLLDSRDHHRAPGHAPGHGLDSHDGPRGRHHSLLRVCLRSDRCHDHRSYRLDLFGRRHRSLVVRCCHRSGSRRDTLHGEEDNRPVDHHSDHDNHRRREEDHGNHLNRVSEGLADRSGTYHV